jgi:diguanylate cyclase (GGDEF)-like protein
MEGIDTFLFAIYALGFRYLCPHGIRAVKLVQAERMKGLSKEIASPLLYVWGPDSKNLGDSLAEQGISTEILASGAQGLDPIRIHGTGVLVCTPIDDEMRFHLAGLGPTVVIIELIPELEAPRRVDTGGGPQHMQLPQSLLGGAAAALAWIGVLASDHSRTAERLSQMLQVISAFRLAGGAEAIYDQLTHELVTHFGFKRGMLFLRKGGQMLLRSLSWPEGGPGIIEMLDEALVEESPLLNPSSPEFEALSLGMATPMALVECSFLPTRARELMAPTREIALVPLFSDQELLGVLTADYGEQHERFLTQGDLALLDTLASLAGAMIYNSWLYMELEERNRELERKVRELTVVSEMTRILNSGDDPREGVSEMLAVVAKVLAADSGFLFLYDEEREELRLAGGYNLPPHARSLWQRLPGLPMELLRDIPATSLRRLAQGDPNAEGPMLPGVSGPTLIHVLRTQTRVVGIWGLGRTPESLPFDPDDEHILTIADNQITVALNSLRLRHLASTDALTGLYSLRHFRDALEQELKLGARLGYAVSLALIDVDNFKKVNDTMGHPAGDAVLATLGASLRATTRRSDICARIGGEEFAVVIPRCGEDCAWGVAEKIRSRISDNHTRFKEQDIFISVSLGLATQEADQELSREEIIRRADAALYVSKRRGRDRATTYDPAEDQETWGTL